MFYTTSLPIYAFITHLITLIMLFGLIFDKNLRYIFFISACFIGAYSISFLLLDDYLNYAYIYSEIDLNKSINQIFSLYGEPLYLAGNYFFKFFTDDFNFVRVFWVFTALIIKLSFLMRWGKFYSISFIFYISLLFYPDSYLLRSSIASSIVFIGISNLLANKKWYKFFVPIIIASGFHISALVAIPIWFLKRIKLSKESSLVVLGLLFLSGFIGLGHFSVQVLAKLFAADMFIVERLIEYSTSIYGGSLGMLRGSSLVYVTVALLFIIYKEQISRHTPNYHIFLNIMLYSFVFLFSFNDFEVISERLFRILAFITVIPMGYIVYCVKEDTRFHFAALMIIALNLIAYIMTPSELSFLN